MQKRLCLYALPYRNERSSEAVFLKRSVLCAACGIMAFKFAQNLIAEHTLSLAVDKNNAHTLLALVFLHCVAHFLQLAVENIGIGESFHGIKQRIIVQIHFYLVRIFHSRRFCCRML